MFGFFEQVWILISSASCSVIKFCCIIDFGIFLIAKRPFVGLCFAKVTTPNFPSPSFLIVSNSSIPYIFFPIFEGLFEARLLLAYFWLLSNDFEKATGELWILFLSMVGVKYKVLPYFCVFPLIFICYYFSTSRCKNAGFFKWFTFFNRSFCWYVSLFTFFNSYIISLFLVILSLSFWHC